MATLAAFFTEHALKITRIETLRLGEFPNIIWVLVHTDDGLIGLGDKPGLGLEQLPDLHQRADATVRVCLPT